jgi:dTMP kinase
MLIVIEGTDSSGKKTQTDLLEAKMEKEGINVFRDGFPRYDTPTGRIIGGPYLGKPHISEGWFPEGALNVPPKVGSAYYAADRYANIGPINEALRKGHHVLLDRYTYSNMGHQGGMLSSKKERAEMFDWIDQLEFGLYELPRSDIVFFLHLPAEWSWKLGEIRDGVKDQLESDIEHIKNAENAYVELAERYDFITIECLNDKGDDLKTEVEIHEEIWQILKPRLG